MFYEQVVGLVLFDVLICRGAFWFDYISFLVPLEMIRRAFRRRVIPPQRKLLFSQALGLVAAILLNNDVIRMCMCFLRTRRRFREELES